MCAILAFCAIAASAAFAVPTVLVDGVVPVANTPAVVEGEVELKDFNGNLAELLNVILCSGIAVGEIRAGGTEVVVNRFETLAHGTIGEDKGGLVGAGLLCEVTFDAGALVDCKAGVNEAEVYPANLPWKLTMELMADGKILGLSPATTGYEVVCKSLLGVSGENLCEGSGSALLTNNLEHVLIMAEEAADSELGSCSLTGEHTTEVRGSGEAFAVEGLTLLATSVSGE